MRVRSTGLLLVMLCASLVAVPPSASATVPPPPPDTSVYTGDSSNELVLDEPLGRIFVSGPYLGGTQVRDLSGALITTVPSVVLSHALLSVDGGTIYSTTQTAVKVIDAATLTLRATWSTPLCPASLALAGGRLWFGSSSYYCGYTDKRVGSFDLSQPQPTAVVEPTSDLGSEADLVGKDGLLFISDRSVSAVTVTYRLREWDVSGSSPVVLHERELPVEGRLSLAPNGDVMVGSTNSSDVTAFRPSDLAADGIWSGAGGPDVATAPGLIAGAGASFRPDGSLLRRYGFYAKERGLAVTSSGDTLYALDSAGYLHVIHRPDRSQVALHMTRPSVAQRTVAFTVTGTATVNEGLPSGMQLDISRSGPHGVVDLPPVTVQDDGTFAFTDTVPDRGSYTYTAVYEGDSDRAATATTVVVPVKGTANAASFTMSAGPYRYLSAVTINVHVTSPGGTAQLVSYDPSSTNVDATRRTLRSGTVDSNGNFAVVIRARQRTGYEFIFAGNDVDEPVKIHKLILVNDAVSGTMLGYYGSSGSYRLYHAGAHPTYHFTFSPWRPSSETIEGCPHVFVERYSSGAWHTVSGSGCVMDGQHGQGTGVYVGATPAGALLRFRAYVKGTPQNVGTYSAYSYAKITR